MGEELTERRCFPGSGRPTRLAPCRQPHLTPRPDGISSFSLHFEDAVGDRAPAPHRLSSLAPGAGHHRVRGPCPAGRCSTESTRTFPPSQIWKDLEERTSTRAAT